MAHYSDHVYSPGPAAACVRDITTNSPDACYNQPNRAKGLNLAVADVTLLVRAITAWDRDGDERGLDAYSRTALRRVWRAELFSAWITTILHADPADDVFTSRLRPAQLEYLVSSRAAQTMLAENYTGMPLDAKESW